MDKLYTVRELSEMFHVKQTTIIRWLKSGKVKGFKVARKWYVKESDLERLMKDGQDDK